MELQYTLENIDDAARKLLSEIEKLKVIGFKGEMGAGKTTFIKHICRVMEVQDVVSSPTFSIINVYESKVYGRIYHMDLYRLESAQEAIEAGVEDCIRSGYYCFIEWPEKVPELFKNIPVCSIALRGMHERKLQLIQ